MREDVTVIIRSSHERTEGCCYRIVAEQVPENCIEIIHEVPFSKAVHKTFSIGAAGGKKWTLAVDADILLKKNAIDDMVKRAEQKPAQTFIYQGCVLDKLYNNVRPGGPHLYRSELLKKAQHFIPTEQGHLRPESFTYRKMAEQNHHFFQDPIVFGLHDYEQYYADIYRKCFIHAKKHREYWTHFLSVWTEVDDQDYKAALKGFFDGLQFKGETQVDIDFFKKTIASGGVSLPDKEKEAMPDLNASFVDDQIFAFLNIPDNVRHLKKLERSSVTEKKPGIINKLMWTLGLSMEVLGRRIKKSGASSVANQ